MSEHFTFDNKPKRHGLLLVKNTAPLLERRLIVTSSTRENEGQGDCASSIESDPRFLVHCTAELTTDSIS